MKSTKFEVACMNIRAPRSLIGLQRATLYCKDTGIDMKPLKSTSNFLFGRHPSKTKILIPTPDK